MADVAPDRPGPPRRPRTAPRRPRRLPGLAVAALLVTVTAAAGCGEPAADPVGDRELVASLRWPTMTVRTTPNEPHEATRPIQASWPPGTFAIWAEAEPELRHRMVVRDGVVYYNQVAGMGWTRFGLDDLVPANSVRLVLWDLPKALADPAMTLYANQTGNVLNVTAVGTLDTPRAPIPVRIEVGAVDGMVVWARESSASASEAPFTFRYDGIALPFDPVVPAGARPLAEVNERNQAAHRGHVDVIKLLQAYARNHACQMPDRPSKDSLALEMLAAGKTWPTNAFTGQELAVGSTPGDMGWTKSGPMDAQYIGWGWDGALVSQAFTPTCT